MPNDPQCTVCLDDFRAFKAVMEDLVGWPVALSWNEQGQAWITGPNLLDFQRAILNDRFRVVVQIVNGLNGIRRFPQSAFKGTPGFHVRDDGIWRKKPSELLARFEFSTCSDHTG